MQRGGAVEQHGVLADDLVQDVPDLGALALDLALGGLDVLREVLLDQALHDEGLEQLQGHLLGQTALVHLQLGAHDDHGTTGVVHALAQQVLTETSLLALEHVGDRLQGAVAGAGHGSPSSTVVEERVHGLLEHALLVVDDDLRGAQLQQPLESRVAVDDATVEVVEVGGREAATVQLHHGAQVRGDDRDVGQHHGLRLVAGLDEGVDDLEALERPGLALAGARRDGLAQRDDLGLQVEGLQALLDGRGPHVALEVRPVAQDHVAVEALVALEVTDLEVLEALPHGLQAVDVLVEATTDLAHLALAGLALLLTLGRLGAVGLHLGQRLLQALGTRVDGGVALVLQVALVHLELAAQVGEVLGATLLVDLGDHVGREVDDLLQVLRGQVQQVPQARGHALEVPDVGDGGGQVDVPHALTAHLGAGDLHAALLAHDALVADTLVLAARALPVACGPEDLLTEETVTLGLEGAVVDGLGLLHLAPGPRGDVVARREGDLEAVERLGVEQGLTP